MVGRQQIADLVVSHEELVDTQASRCPQLVQQQLMQEKFEPPHHLDHVAKTNQVPHHHVTIHPIPNQHHHEVSVVNKNQKSQS